MRVTVVASGSKGNCIIVDAGATRVAVDAGFGPRILAQRLRKAGISPSSISACVVTHEHFDHARGALAARRKWGWTLASTTATLSAIRAPAEGPNILPVELGSDVVIGDARVKLIPISHDAVEPAAVLVEETMTGARVGVAHDLGVVPDNLESEFAGVEILVLEANHDMGMLRAGPYPRHLQDRIAGASGHLSNTQSAEFVSRVAHRGMRAVILAHLSEQNNTPQIARETIGRALRRTIFRGKLGAANQHNPIAIGDAQPLQLRLL